MFILLLYQPVSELFSNFYDFTRQKRFASNAFYQQDVRYPTSRGLERMLIKNSTIPYKQFFKKII